MSTGNERVMLSHGNGGRMMHQLIDRLFLRYFSNPILDEQSDSAILPASAGDMAFTTDSFVVDPIFFPGGNIGKLAVCGTVNDLSVAGATPRYISVAMIIEEGFLLSDLELIVRSLAEEASHAGVRIVTGDTKVVQKGKCDKIFINTAGIGTFPEKERPALNLASVRPGDAILINGTIGDHGMAVMNARESFRFRSPVVSDCASLNHLIREVLEKTKGIRFMRDPTRGGAGSVLNEIAAGTGLGVHLEETALPVSGSVQAMCELLGFDPLYIANEGKVLMVADPAEADLILDTMRNHPLGKLACRIGMITEEHPGKVVMETETGGKRIIDILTGDPLPRIC